MGIWGVIQSAVLGWFLLVTTAGDAQTVSESRAALALEPALADASLFVRINPAKRPWGIIFDDNGSMYVAGNNFEIDRISAAGQATHFGNIHPDFVGPGMAFDPQKNLLIADGKFLLRLSARGVPTPLMADFTRALDLQIDPRGNLLVAADIESRVYAISPSQERRVIVDLQRPPMWFALNSIALDSRGEHLYVADALGGKILKYSLQPDGTAAGPEVIADKIVGLRFLAVDAAENVYANTHFPILIRVDRQKRQRRFFIGQMEDPAGMAFGKKGFDPKALYITNRYGVTKVRLAAL